MDRDAFEKWYTFYRCEPFGGERELLARITSLLYIIASGTMKWKDVVESSDSLMQSLMPPDWIEAKPMPTEIDTIKSAESVFERLFG